MARKYSIYRLTSPSGRAYVGFTGQAVGVRWGQHQRAARRRPRHPLTQALAKYGSDSFRVEVLSEHDDMQDALEAEKAAIAAETNPYNLSAGGETDFMAGHARFRELLQDPAWRDDYLARLSAGIRNSPAYYASRDAALKSLAEWRAENPVKAYKHAMRALRIGQRGRKTEDTEEPQRLPRKPKGPAAKFHKSKASARAAVRHWSEMGAERKAEIHGRISASVAKGHAEKTPEERAAHEAQLAEARKSIDHTVRKARQKEGLAAYWTPERRAAFGESVRRRNAEKRAERDRGE